MSQMLIPTFHHIFPGKKMILMLDNAPYHRCQGPEGGSSIRSSKRPELIEWIVDKCEEQEIESVNWDRNLIFRPCYNECLTMR